MRDVVAEIKASGCEIVSPAQLRTRLAALGYRIDGLSFNYTNKANGTPYKARSCHVVEADTGLSFAHVTARRDGSFRALQTMRRNVECIDPSTGRVWEY